MTATDQRTDALLRANEIRSKCSVYKREIAALPADVGTWRVMELLEEPVTGPLGSIRTITLLMSIRRLGNQKARNLLSRAGVVSGDRRLSELTARQREALRTRLEDRVWR
jgi:hypothetical protein